MTTYKHIVQVHPVENGVINLTTNYDETHKFDTMEQALLCVEGINNMAVTFTGGNPRFKAVYLGRVNDATGELE